MAKKPPPVEPAVAPAVPAVPPRHVYRWDLDKTYLRTDFDTLKQLLRTAFESAEEKQSVPGAAALLRELRSSGGTRICFISGSPRQMRKVLQRKLQIDGVEFDEFILKPNLRNMLTGRFRAIKGQVGYKLPALLAGRAGLPVITQETCFGDDAESDALIYSLYGDVIAGRVERPLIEQILERSGAYEDDIARALTLADSLPKGEAVERIFIRLDRHSPTSRFTRYGERVVPIFNYFQAGLVLLQDGRLDSSGLVRVTLEMVDRFAYTPETLRNSLADLLRRGHIRPPTLTLLRETLADPERLPHLGALAEARHTLFTFGQQMMETRIRAPKKQPDRPIDYLDAIGQL